jgi:hypothetical protein
MQTLQVTTDTEKDQQGLTRRVPEDSPLEEEPMTINWNLPAPPDLDEKFRLAVANEAAALAQHLELMIPESLEALHVASSLRRSIELDLHWRTNRL